MTSPPDGGLSVEGVVAEVLAGHEWTWRVFQQRPVMVCLCGDQLIPSTSSGVAGLEEHRTHVAAEIARALAARPVTPEPLAEPMMPVKEAMHLAGRDVAAAYRTGVADGARNLAERLLALIERKETEARHPISAGPYGEPSVVTFGPSELRALLAEEER